MTPQSSAREALNAILSGRTEPPVVPPITPSVRPDLATAPLVHTTPASAPPSDARTHATAHGEAQVIHFAVGRSARSNKITSQHCVSFPQLVELVRDKALHVGKLTLEQYLAFKSGTEEQKAAAEADKDCAWLSIVHFSKRVRAAANVTAVSGWVQDFA